MFLHLIVDGYNIINKWPSLKKAKNKSLDFARQSLVDIMANYADSTGIKITIVFDGMEKTGLKNKERKRGDLDIIFSKKSETADSIIEKLVYNSQDKNSLVVATDDHCQQNMVFGMGAFYMSSSQLNKKVGEAYEQLRGAISKTDSSKKLFSKISI